MRNSMLPHPHRNHCKLNRGIRALEWWHMCLLSPLVRGTLIDPQLI